MTTCFHLNWKHDKNLILRNRYMLKLSTPSVITFYKSNYFNPKEENNVL